LGSRFRSAHPELRFKVSESGCRGAHPGCGRPRACARPGAAGVGVYDLGVRVGGLGFRVEGVGGLRFRVSGFGFRVSGLNSKVSGLWFKV